MRGRRSRAATLDDIAEARNRAAETITELAEHAVSIAREAGNAACVRQAKDSQAGSPGSLRLCLRAPEIVGRDFQLGLETQRRLKFGNAFPRIARGEQSQAQIVVSLGIVGI